MLPVTATEDLSVLCGTMHSRHVTEYANTLETCKAKWFQCFSTGTVSKAYILHTAPLGCEGGNPYPVLHYLHTGALPQSFDFANWPCRPFMFNILLWAT